MRHDLGSPRRQCNMPTSDAKSLTDVINDLQRRANEDGDLTVGEVLDEFAGRLFGPLLLAPAVGILTPLGMIPTVPSILGLFVVLVAGQSLVGLEHPWLPSALSDRSVGADQYERAMKKFRPWARWIDKFTAPRLGFLVKGPMKYGMAAIAVLVACTLPPLELIPGAAFLPGFVLLVLGLAITAEDGLLGLFGVAGSLAALYLVWAWWPF